MGKSQPTIVEAVSFIAWKDEAFELGLQWAHLYPPGSPSRKLITDTMNTSYLVNIVANDFRDGMSIFEPFLLNQTTVGKVVEGVKGTVEGIVEGVKGVVSA